MATCSVVPQVEMYCRFGSTVYSEVLLKWLFTWCLYVGELEYTTDPVLWASEKQAELWCPSPPVVTKWKVAGGVRRRYISCPITQSQEELLHKSVWGCVICCSQQRWQTGICMYTLSKVSIICRLLLQFYVGTGSSHRYLVQLDTLTSQLTSSSHFSAVTDISFPLSVTTVLLCKSLLIY